MTGGAGAAAIIAGGRGTRLGGQVKGLLVVDGQRILDRQLAVLRPVFERIVLVANDPGPWAGLGVPVVADRFADAGPLAGIEAALATVPDDDGDVVCVAGDMPFLDAGVLRLLRDRAPGADAVVPRVGGWPEPLLARYAARVRPTIVQQLTAGQHAVHRWLEQLACAWIDEGDLRAMDPTLRCLTNLNTPDDVARTGAMRLPR